jgi:hypothetical protein
MDEPTFDGFNVKFCRLIAVSTEEFPIRIQGTGGRVGIDPYLGPS